MKIQMKRIVISCIISNYMTILNDIIYPARVCILYYILFTEIVLRNVAELGTLTTNERLVFYISIYTYIDDKWLFLFRYYDPIVVYGSSLYDSM